MELPFKVYELLQRVAEAILEGKAIAVAPVDEMLTPQEAADFLGISRPTLIKLLDDEAITFERTSGGKHRKLRLQDVLTYQESQSRQRRATLKEMAEITAHDGLYDHNYDTNALNQVITQIRQETRP